MLSRPTGRENGVKGDCEQNLSTAEQARFGVRNFYNVILSLHWIIGLFVMSYGFCTFGIKFQSHSIVELFG